MISDKNPYSRESKSNSRRSSILKRQDTCVTSEGTDGNSECPRTPRRVSFASTATVRYLHISSGDESGVSSSNGSDTSSASSGPSQSMDRGSVFTEPIPPLQDSCDGESAANTYLMEALLPASAVDQPNVFVKTVCNSMKDIEMDPNYHAATSSVSEEDKTIFYTSMNMSLSDVSEPSLWQGDNDETDSECIPVRRHEEQNHTILYTEADQYGCCMELTSDISQLSESLLQESNPYVYNDGVFSPEEPQNKPGLKRRPSFADGGRSESGDDQAFVRMYTNSAKENVPECTVIFGNKGVEEMEFTQDQIMPVTRKPYLDEKVSTSITLKPKSKLLDDLFQFVKKKEPNCVIACNTDENLTQGVEDMEFTRDISQAVPRAALSDITTHKVLPSVNQSMPPIIVNQALPQILFNQILPPVVNQVLPKIVSQAVPPKIVNQAVPPIFVNQAAPPIVSQTVASIVNQTVAPIVSQVLPKIVNQAVAPIVSQTVAPIINQALPKFVNQAVPPILVNQTVPSIVNQTVASIVSKTVAPIVSQTVAPVVSQTVAPIVSQTVAPIVSQTLAPIVSQTVAPIVSQAVAPVISQTVAPVISQTVAPIVSQTVAPIINQPLPKIVSQTVPPVVNQTVAPIVTQAVAPIVIQTVAPIVSQTVAPIVSQIVAPIVSQTMPSVSQTLPSISQTMPSIISQTMSSVVNQAMSPIVSQAVSPIASQTMLPIFANQAVILEEGSFLSDLESLCKTEQMLSESVSLQDLYETLGISRLEEAHIKSVPVQKLSAATGREKLIAKTLSMSRLYCLKQHIHEIEAAVNRSEQECTEKIIQFSDKPPEILAAFQARESNVSDLRTKAQAVIHSCRTLAQAMWKRHKVDYHMKYSETVERGCQTLDFQIDEMVSSTEKAVDLTAVVDKCLQKVDLILGQKQGIAKEQEELEETEREVQKLKLQCKQMDDRVLTCTEANKEAAESLISTDNSQEVIEERLSWMNSFTEWTILKKMERKIHFGFLFNTLILAVDLTGCGNSHQKISRVNLHSRLAAGSKSWAKLAHHLIVSNINCKRLQDSYTYHQMRQLLVDVSAAVCDFRQFSTELKLAHLKHCLTIDDNRLKFTVSNRKTRQKITLGTTVPANYHPHNPLVWTATTLIGSVSSQDVKSAVDQIVNGPNYITRVLSQTERLLANMKR